MTMSYLMMTCTGRRGESSPDTVRIFRLSGWVWVLNKEVQREIEEVWAMMRVLGERYILRVIVGAGVRGRRTGGMVDSS